MCVCVCVCVYIDVWRCVCVCVCVEVCVCVCGGVCVCVLCVTEHQHASIACGRHVGSTVACSTLVMLWVLCTCD